MTTTVRRAGHAIRLAAAASLLWLAATVASAQSAAGHTDILPFDDNGSAPGGKIATGFFDFETSSIVPQSGRFTEPLDAIQPSFFGVQAPGFFNTDAFPLLPNAPLSFHLPAITHPTTGTAHNLFYWDGLDDAGDGLSLDDVAFAPPADGQTLQVRLSSFVNATADGSGSDVPGFVIDFTNAAGTIHKHVSFQARAAGGNQPPDGFYLLPMRLTMPELENSDTFFLLFNAKYQRDTQNNILFNGILPLTDQPAQQLAELWIDTFLLASAPLPGDYNANGQVEQGDLDLVLLNWGADATTPPAGWVNGLPTGLIDQAELDGVLLNWGATAEPDFRGVHLPEPTAGAAGAMLVLGALARRRRPTTCEPPRFSGGENGFRLELSARPV